MPPAEVDIEAVWKWVGGLTALILAARQSFMAFKSDGRDIHLIESETKHVERLEADISKKCLLLQDLESRINEIRALELEGAPDIAVLGVYLEQLNSRKCVKALSGDCPAQEICTHIAQIYDRINTRRRRKAMLLERREDVTETIR